MLLSDIESSLQRLEDVNNRIEFALILAVCTAYENVYYGYEECCENTEWREKYLEVASQVGCVMDNEYINSEWAYDQAVSIAKQLI